MQFYSFVSENPYVEGMIDEPVGTGGRSIDRDLRTLRGVVRSRMMRTSRTASSP